MTINKNKYKLFYLKKKYSETKVYLIVDKYNITFIQTFRFINKTF